MLLNRIKLIRAILKLTPAPRDRRCGKSEKEVPCKEFVHLGSTSATDAATRNASAAKPAASYVASYTSSHRVCVAPCAIAVCDEIHAKSASVSNVHRK